MRAQSLHLVSPDAEPALLLGCDRSCSLLAGSLDVRSGGSLMTTPAPPVVLRIPPVSPSAACLISAEAVLPSVD